MPIYSVCSLDVLGNPVDGYEVNDTQWLGEVYVRPHEETQTGLFEAFNREVVNALTNRKWLSLAALRMLEHGEITVEDRNDVLEVREVEEAFAGTIGGEPRFIAMTEGTPLLDANLRPTGASPREARAFENSRRAAEAELRTDEELETIAGDRPILSLASQEFMGGEGVFWRNTREVMPDRNLEVIASYDPESARIRIEVVSSFHNRPEDQDEFEWYLADWKNRPTFGFDPVSGQALRPTKSQVSEILVSLDRFMENQ